MKKDNTTLYKKVRLRKAALKEIGKRPFVLETHGGEGKVFLLAYRGLDGVVFEKDPKKSEILAEQRPSWRVYEQDVLSSIKGGVCDGLNFSMIDIDPYGDPWPVINTALQLAAKNMGGKIAMCVNDGLRRKAQVGGSWSAASLFEFASKFGNSEVYKNYLEICRHTINEKAAEAGMSLDGWHGYYCGHNNGMTHYAAILSA